MATTSKHQVRIQPLMKALISLTTKRPQEVMSTMTIHGNTDNFTENREEQAKGIRVRKVTLSEDNVSDNNTSKTDTSTLYFTKGMVTGTLSALGCTVLILICIVIILTFEFSETKS